MLNFAMQYAHNLADSLFAVNIPLTLVTAGVALVSWRKRDFNHGGQSYGSDGYANSTWRMWACAQTAGLAWGAWVVVAAVPPPDYQTKVQRVVVEKPVSALATYSQAFEQCKEMDSGEFTDENRDWCDRRALVLTRPNMFIERRVAVHAPAEVKEVRVPDSYAKLYAECLRYYPKVHSDRESLEENVLDRMKLCHSQVLEARRP